MIKSFRTKPGTKVEFGHGTLRLKPHVLQSRPGTQLEIMQCARPFKIGGPVPDNKAYGHKIVLEFQNVESLQVLIDKLEYLKSEMEK